jgi:hypothetical protein
VSVPGEYEDEMSPTGLLGDATVEALVAGDEVDARFDQLAAFARQARTLRDEPLPAPSPALEAVFAGRDPKASILRSRRLAAGAAKVAGLGAVAKIGLGSFAAAASVTAAGAGGVLPDAADAQVRDAIEAVTPVDFGAQGGADAPGRTGTSTDTSTSTDPPHEGGPNSSGNFGERVSDDATGASDGRPGVDGGEVSDEAPGSANRPDDPGAQGRGRGRGRGRDQAGETPAAPDVPDAPGGARGSGREGQPPGAPGPGASNSATAPGSPAPLHPPFPHSPRRRMRYRRRETPAAGPSPADQGG